ncbi:MAG TPA: hypothetical protein VGP82_08835 [Ktedonobacterales bacterium]|jgi:hypothetical protein|nr:hypothetical protein [Ktedonobacterales bacterium]
MQRREMLALVAGVSVGLGGGTLSAFLACTACRAMAQRVQEQSGYIDLGPPGPLLNAPLASSATEQNLPQQEEVAVSGART